MTASVVRASFAGREVAVAIVRSPRARRLSLRADAVRGIVRVALPPRGRVADAQAFVAAHPAWPVAVPFAPGATIPFDGGTLTIDWSAGHARGVRRLGDRLAIGGAVETVPGRTSHWLRAAALAALAPATHDLAATLARTVAAVAVRDPAGRWGSCSARGAIGYSWRLILAPPAVRHSVVAHEVAHLVHPDHGRAFWRLAERLTGGDVAPSRAWLAANGAALHWIGRDAA